MGEASNELIYCIERALARWHERANISLRMRSQKDANTATRTRARTKPRDGACAHANFIHLFA